ncbi:MAG: AAA-like domain-containing protein [Deltaproteobacteria bacterium]|nr:AAA-like domain-containing protein [Deltaproteobacteria bacterium]
MSGGFQLGGALRPGALYLTRAADEEALTALLAGDAIAVLAPRQHGKSSLRLRLAARLAEAGIPTVHLDLTGFGVPKDPQRWMSTVVEELQEEAPLALGRPNPALRPGGDPVAQLKRLIDHLNTQGPWALLVDELDSLISSPGAAELLLGALRAAWDHQARAGAAHGMRLGLFGVLAPFELGLDPHRTPFNITRSIPLDDFTAQELAPLAALLPTRGRDALLAEILAWTAGQPYLTQRLAERVAAEPNGLDAAAQVAAQVERLFLRGGEHHDPNLAGVARQVGAAGVALPELLSLYRAALRPEGVEADGRRAATTRLLLTGLATWRSVPGGARLFVRNRLYATVFDDVWAQAQLERRPFAAAFETWELAGRTNDSLLRGEALAKAETWARGRVDLSQDEMGFLLRSAEVWRQEEAGRLELEQRRLGAALAEEQQQRQRQRTRSLAIGLVLATVAIVLLVWLSVGLRDARDLSEASAALARTAAATTFAQTAQQALRLPDLAEAELQAAASLVYRESPAARGVLLQAGALSRLQHLWSRELVFGENTSYMHAGGDRILAPYGRDALLVNVAYGGIVKQLDDLGRQGRAISPDGARVLGQRSNDSKLVWMDGETGETLWTGPVPMAPGRELDSALLEPGGEVGVLILHDGPLLRFRFTDQTVLWSTPFAKGARCMPSLNAELGLLAIGCSNGHLEVRRIQTGALVFETLGRPVGGYALAWAGDTLVFAGRRTGGDGLVYAWREGAAAPWVALSPAALTVWGSAQPPLVSPLQIASLTATDTQTVWAGLDDGTVVGISLPTQTLFSRARLGVGAVWVSATPTRLLTFISGSRALRAWEKPIAPTGLQPLGSGLSLSAVAVSPNAIAVATTESLVELRDPLSGAVLGAVSAPATNTVVRVLWVGDTLWAGTHEGGLLRAVGDQFEPVDTLPPGTDSGVSGLTTDRSGQRIAVKRSNGPLTVHHKDGAAWSLPCDSNRDAVGFSDDGRWLAATCADAIDSPDVLMVWSVNQDGPLLHSQKPLELARGSTLVWVGDTLLIGLETPTGKIMRWHPTDGLTTWPGRAVNTVLDLAVSPDGSLVATIDLSGYVLVWTPSGRLLASLGPIAPMALRVHLDETHLTARLSDGKIARWPLHTLSQPALPLYEALSAAWNLTLLNNALVSTFGAGGGNPPCPLTGPQHAGVNLSFDEDDEERGWFIVEGRGPELRTRGELVLGGETYTVHEASSPPWASLNGDFGWEIVAFGEDDEAVDLRINSSCEPDDVKRGYIMAMYSLSGAAQRGTTTDGSRVRVSPRDD